MEENLKKEQLRMNTETLVDNIMSLAKSMEKNLLDSGQLKESIIDKELSLDESLRSSLRLAVSDDNFVNSVLIGVSLNELKKDRVLDTAVNDCVDYNLGYNTRLALIESILFEKMRSLSDSSKLINDNESIKNIVDTLNANNVVMNSIGVEDLQDELHNELSNHTELEIDSNKELYFKQTLYLTATDYSSSIATESVGELVKLSKTYTEKTFGVSRDENVVKNKQKMAIS